MAMAPERGAHLRVKGAIYKALDRAVAVAGVPCQPLPDGATVETGDSDYEPDALVNCGEPKADDAVAAPNPVIIVEVLSPGTTSTDTGGKLADYFRVPSVAHYLIVHPTRRTVTHHRRTDDGIDTRIVVNGPIRMAPPGSSSPWKKSTVPYRPIVRYHQVRWTDEPPFSIYSGSSGVGTVPA